MTTATLTAPLDTLDTVTLPTAVVRIGDGTHTYAITVPCEPINPHLAIAAHVYLTADGPRLADGHRILHRPTGRYTGGPACLHCARKVGRRLVDLGIDWATEASGQAFMDRLTSGQADALVAVLNRLHKCDLMSCEERKGF